MALSTYTTYDQVRAVLGVSDEELEDSVLALPIYEDMLRMEMDAVNIGVHGKYVELVAMEPLTDIQQQFLRYFRLFCTYATAKALISGLPMFGPKAVGDGKATMTRFSDSPYKTTIERVESEFARLSNLLEGAYSSLAQTGASAFVRPWLVTAGNAVDPVTG